MGVAAAMIRKHRAEEEAVQLIKRAKMEFGDHAESFNDYQIDVELLASLIYKMGIQRVPGLAVGERVYAGMLIGKSQMIVVNENDHEHRQRFTIAHEIGHYVLHYLPEPGKFETFTDEFRASDFSFRPGTSSHAVMEWEANVFAAELLMPENALRAMHKINRKLTDLVKHFKVSPEAMRLRLQRLGLAAH